MDTPLQCTLIHAPDPKYSANQNYGAKFIPVWACTLNAHIPADGRFDVRLWDVQIDPAKDIDKADVYLFSGINQDCGFLLEINADLKRRFPNSVSCIGGPIAWSFDQAGSLEQLSPFDHVCIGHGEALIEGLLEKIRTGVALEHVIRADEAFAIGDSKAMDFSLLDDVRAYYGGVIEVARGCPFLCEFCDIRVMRDNNRTHAKPPALIVEELDWYARQGVQQVLFACDNFIGDLPWAEALVDAIIAWRERTGRSVGLYTWLTINLHRHPELMRKMRVAGFDMLFIGIESFNTNSLLETAKIQNTTRGLIDAVQGVQSYGFLVVAGLIFGFDSDDADCFDVTVRGLEDASLLSGDPSLLTALPGTPLYRRMKLSGRLRDVRFGLGGFKYRTNIRYLLPKEELLQGFQDFVTQITRGDHQYRRLRGYFELLSRGNFVPSAAGFGNPWLFLKFVAQDPQAARQLVNRGVKFASVPSNLYFTLRGLAHVARQRSIPGRLRYFNFWLFTWTNAVLKYHGISTDDFDIDSVAADFDIHDILPTEYEATANEPIPRQKIESQLRVTVRQLRALIKRRLGESTPSKVGAS